jgi:hypothetical protein
MNYKFLIELTVSYFQLKGSFVAAYMPMTLAPKPIPIIGLL